MGVFNFFVICGFLWPFFFLLVGFGGFFWWREGNRKIQAEVHTFLLFSIRLISLTYF